MIVSLFEAVFCGHERMAECHDGCGHFWCPCGIIWDDGAEGGPFDDELYDCDPGSDPDG